MSKSQEMYHSLPQFVGLYLCEHNATQKALPREYVWDCYILTAQKEYD